MSTPKAGVWHHWTSKRERHESWRAYLHPRDAAGRRAALKLPMRNGDTLLCRVGTYPHLLRVTRVDGRAEVGRRLAYWVRSGFDVAPEEMTAREVRTLIRNFAASGGRRKR